MFARPSSPRDVSSANFIRVPVKRPMYGFYTTGAGIRAVTKLCKRSGRLFVGSDKGLFLELRFSLEGLVQCLGLVPSEKC